MEIKSDLIPNDVLKNINYYKRVVSRLINIVDKIMTKDKLEKLIELDVEVFGEPEFCCGLGQFICMMPESSISQILDLDFVKSIDLFDTLEVTDQTKETEFVISLIRISNFYQSDIAIETDILIVENHLKSRKIQFTRFNRADFIVSISQNTIEELKLLSQLAPIERIEEKRYSWLL